MGVPQVMWSWSCLRGRLTLTPTGTGSGPQLGSLMRTPGSPTAAALRMRGACPQCRKGGWTSSAPAMALSSCWPTWRLSSWQLHNRSSRRACRSAHLAPDTICRCLSPCLASFLAFFLAAQRLHPSRRSTHLPHRHNLSVCCGGSHSHEYCHFLSTASSVWHSGCVGSASLTLRLQLCCWALGVLCCTVVASPAWCLAYRTHQRVVAVSFQGNERDVPEVAPS